MKEIYDLNGRLERVTRTIRNSAKVSNKNKELIFKFHNDMFAEGLSTARVLFYMNRLWNIARWVCKDFDEMTDEDLKSLVRTIQMMDYKEATKLDHNVVIKKFFKWMDGDSERVKWIRAWSRNEETRLPEELLTQEDAQKMIRACYNVRDKAMISALWESGCRVGELLSMMIKNLQFDKYGATMIVHGKTGWRRIRLVSSVPHLANWLEHHPLKDNPEAPLWVSIGTRNSHKQLLYYGLYQRLRRIAERAGIQKKVNPHIFRHARATFLANHLTEAQMKEYFGWVQSSKMASIYVHLSGRDTDEVILKMYGKWDGDSGHELAKPKICPTCSYENAPEAEFCIKCRRPLNVKSAMKAIDLEKEFLQVITPDVVEQMVKNKVKEILTEYLPLEKLQQIKVSA